ncbi:MAG: Kelch repeat-containing protein [Solirubrobacteraceae bacterium]
MRGPRLAACLVVSAVAAGCGTVHAAPGTTATTSSRVAQAFVATAARAPSPARRIHAVRAALTRWRLPAPVYRTVAVATGGRIYVLGGHDAAGATIDTVDALNPATGRSRIAGRLALPTHGAAAGLLGGRVLVIGGASDTVHTVVQQFIPARGAARIVGALPGARADVTAAVLGRTLVLVGGFDGVGPQSAIWASGDGRHFRAVARLRQAVRYPAAVAAGHCVYVFGGLISGGEYDGRFSDLVQRVCHGRRWTSGVAGRLPVPVAHAMGALLDGQILVLGGSTPRGPSAWILRFDPSGGAVRRAGRLPRPLTDAAIATIAGSAYLLGGISSGGPVASVVRVTAAAGPA